MIFCGDGGNLLLGKGDANNMVRVGELAKVAIVVARSVS